MEDISMCSRHSDIRNSQLANHSSFTNLLPENFNSIEPNTHTKNRIESMKQKIVLKVTMPSAKCRSKAMKVAVGVAGVESAAIQGDDKNQIVVTGDGIDSVLLTKLFRKHIGFTELASVGPVVVEKKEKETKIELLPYQYYYQFGVPAAQHYCYPYEACCNNSYSFMW